jgi:hypothetical protein
VIVEGVCDELVPDGSGEPVANAWRLVPVRALAWERFPRDATRFTF